MSETPSAEKDVGLTIDQAADLLRPIFQSIDTLRASMDALDAAVSDVMRRVTTPGGGRSDG